MKLFIHVSASINKKPSTKVDLPENLNSVINTRKFFKIALNEKWNASLFQQHVEKLSSYIRPAQWIIQVIFLVSTNLKKKIITVYFYNNMY